MKKTLLCLSAAGWVFASAAQDRGADSLVPVCGTGEFRQEIPFSDARVEVDTDAGDDGIFDWHGMMPTFQGGDLAAFRTWVYRRARYPREAFDSRTEGRVCVTFVIDTLGRMTRVKWLPGGNGLTGTDSMALVREVVRVVSASPRWEPGRTGDLRSVRISVKYTLPVDFRLVPEPNRRFPAVCPPVEWTRE